MKKTRIAAIVLCALLVLALTGCDSSDYKSAVTLTENGDWAAARDVFAALADYKDSADMVTECDYQLASEAMKAGEIDEAITAFSALGTYKDSADVLTECRYQKAQSVFASGDFEGAEALFEALGTYKDSADVLTECRYQKAQAALEAGDYEGAEALFTELGEYKDCADMVSECKYQAAVAHYDAGEYEEAMVILAELVDYKETDRYFVLCMLQYDQQSFVDLMAMGMNTKFIMEDVDLQLTESDPGYERDERSFLVDFAPDLFRTYVIFNHTNGDSVTYADGQINRFAVMAESYDADYLELAYAEWLLSSGVLMGTLVDGTVPEEFVEEQMLEAMDNTVDGSSEFVAVEYADFEYAGYNCRVSFSDFGDNINRFIFSVTVPELVEAD